MSKTRAQLIRMIAVNQAFNPADLTSRPTEKQDEVLRDVWSRHKYVIAGNQCLAEDTLVITTKGIKKIQDIKAGEYVFDENGKPIKVLKTFENGIKPVHKITHRNMELVKATENHVFLTRNSSARSLKIEELKVEDFKRDTQIKRVEVTSMLGSVVEKDAYAIAVFLGDGCSRTPGKVISGADVEVIEKVQSIIGGSITVPKSNYSWRLKGNPHCNHYDEWCKDKYAHEKYVDIEIIKSWDRTSLLNFVAGIIDTDGSVFVDKWNNICISAEMQAETVIQALQYAFLALWQTETNICKSNREKYVNGPTYIIKVANNAYSKRILKELSPYLQCERKQWKEGYGGLDSKRSNSEWTGVKVSNTVELVPTYDIHVDSETNLYCLANGLVTHNSGKSQTKARDVAWKLTETHPYWSRPNSKRCMNKLCESNEDGAEPDFGITISNRNRPNAKPTTFSNAKDYKPEDGDDIANAIYSCNKCKCKWMDWKQEPLTLVVGSKTSQLTGEMWDKKILPFLEGVKIRVEKAGHAVKKVINVDESSPGYRNEILFFSHDNAKQASARMQGITVHDVWLDELPDSWKLVEELHQRTAARRSQFCATFTPKTPNPEVRRIIDESDRSIVSVYRFGMLDNPAYANRREEQLKTLEGLSEAMKRCILYGDWLDGDEKVFLFTKESNVVDSIQDYDPSWPHVLSVDPAMSIVGWSVACWSPIEERWFVVRAEYQKVDKSEDSPKTIIEKIERKVSKYNIVRRIYDCHETWWMTTAREEFGLRYIPVRKDKRKKELLVNLIKAVGERKILFVGEMRDCYDELHRAEWHPDKDHVIKGATHYHIVDSLQYLIDLLPKNVEGIKKPLTYDQELYKLHKQEKKIKEEVAKASGYNKIRKIRKLLKFNKKHRGRF